MKVTRVGVKMRIRVRVRVRVNRVSGAEAQQSGSATETQQLSNGITESATSREMGRNRAGSLRLEVVGSRVDGALSDELPCVLA